MLRTWSFSQLDSALDLSLLEFLRQEKIPIASSCLGEGVCRKCVFNTNKLACQFTLSDLFAQSHDVVIKISYL